MIVKYVPAKTTDQSKVNVSCHNSADALVQFRRHQGLDGEDPSFVIIMLLHKGLTRVHSQKKALVAF